MADVTDVCAIVCVCVCLRACLCGGGKPTLLVHLACVRECRGSYMIDAFSCGSCF